MLVGQPNAEELAEQIVTRGLNVRQVEEMARRDGKKQAREVRRTGRLGPDPDAAALEKRLTDVLGLSVRILHRVDGEGVISALSQSGKQLDDIARQLETPGPVTGTTAPDSAGGGPRIRTPW